MSAGQSRLPGMRFDRLSRVNCCEFLSTARKIHSAWGSLSVHFPALRHFARCKTVPIRPSSLDVGNDGCSSYRHLSVEGVMPMGSIFMFNKSGVRDYQIPSSGFVTISLAPAVLFCRREVCLNGSHRMLAGSSLAVSRGRCRRKQ